MATTPNFGWVMPDPTDFVTNLPADFEVFGDDVDADVWAIKGTADAAISKTIVDAAGDLIYGTANDTVTRLGIGTAGQVLTVNSGATAPQWAAPASGWSPNLTLLNTGGTALTGAGTITVNVASYDSYFIFCDTASSTNASALCRIRFNGDTGSNYAFVNLGSQGTSVFNQVNLTSVLNIMKMDTSAGSNFSFMASVIGGKTSGLKIVSATSSAGTGTGAESFATTGYWNGGSAITSISLVLSTGNFDQGTVYVYGG